MKKSVILKCVFDLLIFCVSIFLFYFICAQVVADLLYDNRTVVTYFGIIFLLFFSIFTLNNFYEFIKSIKNYN